MTDKRKQKIRGQQIAIKKRLLKNQNYPHCEYCGIDNKKILQIHHIKPICEGGDNEEDNLIILCPNCHKSVHSGLISRYSLIQAKKSKKFLVKPEQIQKKLEDLKQKQTKLLTSIIEGSRYNMELMGENRRLEQHIGKNSQLLQGFHNTHKDIKTKVQLCTYLNRIELKYQTLKEDYAKLQLENERLKTDLKNFELATEKAEVKEKKGVFHFLGTAFFGLS